MKDFVLKTIPTCLVILLMVTANFAQEAIRQMPLDRMTFNSMLTSRDAAILKRHFEAQGYRENGFIQEGTTRLSGNDVEGAFTLDLATVKMQIGQNVVELSAVTLKRGEQTEVAVWAEDGAGDGTIYKVKLGLVITTPAATAKVSIMDCVKQFEGLSSCFSCVDCVKNCVQSKSKFWGKILCSARCLGPCIKCGVNVVKIVSCFIKALKG